MLHQWFNLNFMKLQELLFVHKENKNNDFLQQFLLFQSVSAAIHENTTMNACGATDAGAGVLMQSPDALSIVYKQRNAHICIVVLSWMTAETDPEDMSLLPFQALNVSGPLPSTKGQKALRIPQKYLNLCSKDERRSCGFGTTWGRVITDSIFIFGWTNPSFWL